MSMKVNGLSLDTLHQWNDSSLTMLYACFFKALVNYSFQMTSDEEISKDIVQEVFWNLWKNKPSFKTIAQLKVYLYTGVRNGTLNQIRAIQAERAHVVRISDRMQEYQLAEDGAEEFFPEEVYRQLFLSIDELPRRQREIFLMSMEGKKNGEIAKTLDISIDTVKTHKRRAIMALRDKLSLEVFSLLFVLVVFNE